MLWHRKLDTERINEADTSLPVIFSQFTPIVQKILETGIFHPCVFCFSKKWWLQKDQSSPEAVKKFSTGKTLHSLGFTPPDKPSHIKSLVKT